MSKDLLLLILFSALCTLSTAKPSVQLLDETFLPKIDYEEDTANKGFLDTPVMPKPHKMADRKHKAVDGSLIEKMENVRGPMNMAPSVDLFQQLMLPIDSVNNNEPERLFSMKYTKFDENPQGENGPK